MANPNKEYDGWNKSVPGMHEAAKPNFFTLFFSGVPIILFITLYITITERNPIYLTIIIIFIAIGAFTKPLESCGICGKKIKKEVKGLYEMHVQCECVKNRWRPVWFSWMESLGTWIKNKIRTK